jgi:hypothetical protein
VVTGANAFLVNAKSTLKKVGLPLGLLIGAFGYLCHLFDQNRKQTASKKVLLLFRLETLAGLK